MFTKDYHSTNFITGLRAIAILMVFLIHSGGAGLQEVFNFGTRIVNMGKYGVDIFFVVSGFTIFYQFFKRHYSFRDFMKIRILRVSVPYFPIILFLYFYILLGGHSTNSWALGLNNGIIDLTNLFTHIFYISYINIKYANTIIGVEWTLSIEVFFYILLGLMIYKFKSLSSIKNTILFLVIFFIIGICIIYLGKISDKQLFINWLPFRYGYMFLLGGLAYHLREYIYDKFNNITISNLSNFIISFWVISFIIFLTDDSIPDIRILNELFFTIFTFLLIIFVNNNSILSNLFTNKLMIFLGNISFSFYLIHMLILKANIFDLGIENKILEFIYLFSVTIIFSTIYYYLFEIRIYQNLKNKIREYK